MNLSGLECSAHLDESITTLREGRWLYGIAVVLSAPAARAAITETLCSLCLPGRAFLHHHDETSGRRLLIAKAITDLPLAGAVIITATTTNTGQERARARILATLLPRLQHAEHVRQVIVESRSNSDRHDLRTRDRLRRSRQITADLRVTHVRKEADPLVWLPDFVIGAYFSAHHRDQREPWTLIENSHVVDIVTGSG